LEAKMYNKRIANLIIAGVNKAGTTSLYYYFNAHPEVACSLDKETCYFLPIRYGKPLLPIEEYQFQFRSSGSHKYVMEATPGYFYGGKKIAEAIKQTCGNDVKIILIFRNPVNRLISFFKRKKEMLALPEHISLGQYIKLCESKTEMELLLEENNIYTGIHSGFYYKHIKDWFEVFDNNLKIIFFEDLQKDAKSCLQELCLWLDIDPDFYQHHSFDIKNRSKKYRFKWIQKIAVYVNSEGKRIWRKNERLKNVLRTMYHNINSSSHKEEDFEKRDIEYLNRIYEKPNKDLADYLSTKGIKNLPAWLVETHSQIVV
jgi:hypothetical protein